jgi:pyruvate/2-oxoglutarate dehydrogenase complex dihydrolipoamide acyltransferase (E2) component
VGKAPGTPRLTAVRKGLIWWFRPPANPYVSLNVAFDFSAARAYLAGLPADPPVTVHHLLVACVGRLLREFPEANARVVGGRIVRLEGVNVGVPVSLLGHPGGRTGRELSLALLERADQKSLVELSRESAAAVGAERRGRSSRWTIRQAIRAAEVAPRGILECGLDALDRLASTPAGAELAFRLLPMSTGLTNPGSEFGRGARLGDGVLFRAAAFAPPSRLVHLGTLWGVSVLQDEVVAIGGRPEVRPMLPILFVFDHRLFDGAVAGRMLLRLGQLLREPAAAFGRDGTAGLPA